MARTWTLAATLSIISGGSLGQNSRALTNAGRTEMYFKITSSPLKIYKWDGVSLTDIAGTTFSVTTDEYIEDFCVFDGDLFASYGVNYFLGGPGSSIYRYTGGTSWTNEYTLATELAPPVDVGWTARGYATTSTPDSWVWPMDCDNNYMVVFGSAADITLDNDRRFWMRDTGGNWSQAQMPGSIYNKAGLHAIGLSKGSDYGTLYGYYIPSASDYQPVVRGGPSPWTNLTGAAIGLRVPIGYGDSKSFWSHNTSGSTWELKYSNDFGVTLFTAGGLTRTGAQRASFKFKNLGSGIIMLSVDSNQAYTWDTGTATFVADGTTGSQTIYDFFILNDTLYALTDSGTANSVEIWTAGLITCSASFYYGIEVPEFVSNLPFCVEPGGLAISPETHIAVLGTGGGGGQSVVYQQPPYNLAQWNDISGIVPTGTAVTSIKFV